KSEMGGGIGIGAQALQQGQSGDVEVLASAKLSGDLDEGLKLLQVLGRDFLKDIRAIVTPGRCSTDKE
ncbi:MAG: hypothetical protein KJZ78_19425, partial [Bryobacteraceae bacterium]|nr:hypothetical protein [Bryobacteraceae bacterium]